MFSIVISEKGGAERREVFERSEISVGRVQGNDLMLPKGNVSKRHARLLFRDDRFIVTDLNSTNGTYVNRRRISQATIVREGDRIYIGDFVLRIEPQSEGADEGDGSTQAGRVKGSLEANSEGGTEAPVVPGPPRVPTGARAPVAPAPPLPKPLRPTAPEPTRPSLPAPRYPVTVTVEPEAVAYRHALRALVERVAGSLDPGDLDGDVVGIASRISQVMTTQSNRLRAGGEVPSNVDLDRLAGDARAELLGTGPLDALLKDPDVSEIVIEQFDRIHALRRVEYVAVEPPFSSEASLNRALRRLCEQSGTPLSVGEHVLERQLDGGAVLTAAVMPCAVKGAVAVLRKPRRTTARLEDLVREGVASAPVASFLEQCVTANVNVLVCGPRDLATSRVVGALGAAMTGQPFVVQRTGDLAHSEWARSFVSARRQDDVSRLVDLAGRVPNARLVVEMASPELSAALVMGAISGIEGVIGVVYAGSLRRALARVPGDLMASRPGITPEAAREWVSTTFEIALEVGRLRDGKVRILQVCEITGTGSGGLTLQEVFSFMTEHSSPGRAVQGTFVASGAVPRVVEVLQARGLTVDTAQFRRAR